MLNKSIINLIFFAALAQLTACSQPHARSPQYAQKSHTQILRGAAMADTCVEHAASRYNMLPQRIKVLGVDAYQGSYEMRGYTPRQEAFTCSFDGNGEFLHLSMR